MITQTRDFRTLRSNIFEKTKKFGKPFLPVHMGLSRFFKAKKLTKISWHCLFKGAMHSVTWCPVELGATLQCTMTLLEEALYTCLQCTLWPDVQKNWVLPNSVQWLYWRQCTHVRNVLCDLMSRRTGCCRASPWPTRTPPSSRRRPGPCTSSWKVYRH